MHCSNNFDPTLKFSRGSNSFKTKRIIQLGTKKATESTYSIEEEKSSLRASGFQGSCIIASRTFSVEFTHLR